MSTMRFLSQRNTAKLLSVAAFLLLVTILYVADPQSIKGQRTDTSIIPTKHIRLPTPTPQVLSETTDSQGTVYYPVVKVVDGDTVTIQMDGKKQTIRLIGINTPETVDPRREVECYGKEASAYAKQLLTGMTLRLVADPTQQERDRYGRLLRYIYLSDGTLVNQKMIEEGYAYEYTYDEPYQLKNEFIAAQTRARDALKGLWGSGGCGG